jgi:hypothetical protein
MPSRRSCWERWREGSTRHHALRIATNVPPELFAPPVSTSPLRIAST